MDQDGGCYFFKNSSSRPVDCKVLADIYRGFLMQGMYDADVESMLNTTEHLNISVAGQLNTMKPCF